MFFNLQLYSHPLFFVKYRGKCNDIKYFASYSTMNAQKPLADLPSFVPYNLLTQHSIPDKSIADCVEALIGAYLISCGQKGALLLMTWLGLTVLPECKENEERILGNAWDCAL